ncbi:MAG: S-layer homology domain-containing protein, partial [Eggerthellaceae bacterium]|nr:S-layer homology domain-containing protein [Eggerthellaceae bacterium]
MAATKEHISTKIKVVIATLVMFIFILSFLPSASYAEDVTEKFVDVQEDDWYTEYVQWVVDNDYMNGYSGPDNEELFGAGQSLLRGEFAQILLNYSGEEPYESENDTTGLTDLAENPDWYTG